MKSIRTSKNGRSRIPDRLHHMKYSGIKPSGIKRPIWLAIFIFAVLVMPLSVYGKYRSEFSKSVSIVVHPMLAMHGLPLDGIVINDISTGTVSEITLDMLDSNATASDATASNATASDATVSNEAESDVTVSVATVSAATPPYEESSVIP